MPGPLLFADERETDRWCSQRIDCKDRSQSRKHCHITVQFLSSKPALCEKEPLSPHVELQLEAKSSFSLLQFTAGWPVRSRRRPPPVYSTLSSFPGFSGDRPSPPCRAPSAGAFLPVSHHPSSRPASSRRSAQDFVSPSRAVKEISCPALPSSPSSSPLLPQIRHSLTWCLSRSHRGLLPYTLHGRTTP